MYFIFLIIYHIAIFKATLTPHNKSKVMPAGSTQLLICKSSTRGKGMLFSFYHNGKRLQHGPKNKLYLKKLKKSHIGNYQCRVTIGSRRADSAIYRLYVKGEMNQISTQLNFSSCNVSNRLYTQKTFFFN